MKKKSFMSYKNNKKSKSTIKSKNKTNKLANKKKDCKKKPYTATASANNFHSLFVIHFIIVFIRVSFFIK